MCRYCSADLNMGADLKTLPVVTSEAVIDDILGHDAPADGSPANQASFDHAPADDAPADDAPANDALVDDTLNGEAPKYQSEGSYAKSSIQEVEVRVSSRHLSLASHEGPELSQMFMHRLQL